MTGVGGERSRRLLAVSASIDAMRRASRVPRPLASPLPAPAPADERPRCSAFLAHQFALLCDGEYDELMPEWLGLLVRAGVRLPERMVPRLLDRALRGSVDLDLSLVRRAAGPLGAWLAQINPDWRPLLPASFVEQSFAEADRQERLRMLRALRAAHPAEARARIDAGLEREPAKERGRWLAILRDGLGPDDLPLVERARLDKSAPVRELALELTLAIESSAVALELWSVVRGWLHVAAYDSGLVTRALAALRGSYPLPQRLVCTLPSAAPPYYPGDAAAVQDSGVAPTSPDGATRRHAASEWLSWGIAHVPPARWLEVLDLDRDQLAGALLGRDVDELVRHAFAEATVRFADRRMADALVEAMPEEDFAELGHSLAELVTDAAWQRVARRDLERDDAPLLAAPRSLQRLTERGATWPDDPARRVSRRLIAGARAGSSARGRDLERVVEALAARAPLEVLAELSNEWSALRPKGTSWLRIADRVLAILEFRRQMQKEFRR